MLLKVAKSSERKTFTYFFFSRAMAATVDKTTDSRLHDLVMDNFGLTPFLNTYPDFLAGGAVMITALFIAAGMEVQWTFCIFTALKKLYVGFVAQIDPFCAQLR